MVKTTNNMWDTSCDTCICNDCKMNEAKGIYGGCLDCEDCEDGDMHCEDCSMYEKETKQIPHFIVKISEKIVKVGDQLGLDFGIQKRRKGEAYENLRWEDAHDSWRNCHEVKRIFSETIEFNDEYYYPITIGAMQILIKKLSDELQKVDFNKMDEVDEYSVNKLLCAIEDLSKIINDAIWDYQNGIEYEYRVFDSF